MMPHMSHPASPHRGVVACVFYSASGHALSLTLDEVESALHSGGDGFAWLGLYEPDEALMNRVQSLFGLHPLAVEDAHKAHQRAKIEAYGDSLFLALHTAQQVGGDVTFGETHVFVGKRYLVTVRHDASLSYAPARQRCEAHPDKLRLGPSYGLYAVLDFIVDNLLPITDELRAELVQLEQAIFSDTYRRETIQRLYHLRGELTRLRLAVAPLQDILGQLVRLHPELIRDEMRLYFRDVLDHAVRVNEAIDTLREMVTAAMTVNLSLVTVAQGEVVKRLAGWAALVAVPTLVASWYGMNFERMPELAGEYSYYVVAGITGLLVAGVYGLLRRARWL